MLAQRLQDEICARLPPLLLLLSLLSINLIEFSHAGSAEIVMRMLLLVQLPMRAAAAIAAVACYSGTIEKMLSLLPAAPAAGVTDGCNTLLSD